MSENNWKEALKRISLMGLNATDMVPELTDFFQLQNISGEPTKQILAGISLMSLQKRGHFPFKKVHKKHQLSPFPQGQDYISQHQNGLLSQILDEEYQWAMYEFITIIKAQNLLIPAFRIPDLVDYALSETWFKPWIKKTTGMQGDWALSHIPRWENRYNQIQSGHWQAPRSIEKKVFPLLNLSSPIPNLPHILPYIDFPAKTWSEKFSQRMNAYLLTCFKLPNIDVLTQEYLDELIHFTSYLTNTSNPIYWEETHDNWHEAIQKYNQVLKFRTTLI